MLRVKDQTGKIRLIPPDKVTLATLDGEELTIELAGRPDHLVFVGEGAQRVAEALENHTKRRRK